MKTKILCWVGIMWGGGIVIRGFITGPTVPGSASEAGGFAAFALVAWAPLRNAPWRLSLQLQ